MDDAANDSAERDALVVLSLVDGLGPTLTHRCVEALGSASRVLVASTSDLAMVKGIGSNRAAKVRVQIDRISSGGELDREMQLIAEHGVTLVSPADDGYPRLLRHIPDPPPLLYVRGQLREEDAFSLAMVGSRRCTHYGREQADRLASLAASAGLCVVSGGAYGIDAAVHHAALRAAGRTIAVLGSGLARPYPEKHADLFDRIAAGQGAVVSELPMTFPAMGENFPRRNRIISGLSLGVLVIEAAARSGALITARLCAEEHGREVMAVPGRVDSPVSAGCHRMIRESWATLVTSFGDVLDALGETGQMLKAGLAAEPIDAPEGQPIHTQNLTDTQRQIVDALDEPRNLDELAVVTRLAVAAIQADLTVLQIRGAIDKQGPVFTRTHR